MNCYEHPEVGAVIQCTNCSKGLCRDCAGLHETPLCQACANQIISNAISDAKNLHKEIKRQQVKSVLAIIWASILMLFGIYAAVGRIDMGDWWFQIIIFFGFGSLPWLIGKSSNKVETTESQLKKIRSDMLTLSFGPGAATGKLFGNLVVVLISFVFAAILTPFRVVMTIIELRQLKKSKIEIEKMIEEQAH